MKTTKFLHIRRMVRRIEGTTTHTFPDMDCHAWHGAAVPHDSNLSGGKWWPAYPCRSHPSPGELWVSPVS